MLHIIEIHDKDGRGVLAIDLRDILQCLSGEAHIWRWGVVEFECTGNVGKYGDENDINERIKSGGGVWTLSWKELNEFATAIFQTYNSVFVACKSSTDLAQYAQDRDDSLAELVIENVDAGFWEVRSQAEHHLQAMEAHFRVTKRP